VIIRATINGQPSTVTAQQKGVCVVNGKPVFYTKKKVANAQRSIVAHLAPARPAKPMTGNIAMTLIWTFAHPKGSKQKGDTIWHNKRPDLDNLVKGVLDALKPAGWIEEDARICALLAMKQYGPAPMLIVEAKPAEDIDHAQ
jgi:Holliday junction resolvase RusA-like endonuclease